ncbi:sel1 repeat family protein [Clostridium butyricum]|nr:sel1 repeat family protein [Clostridium butyricum]
MSGIVVSLASKLSFYKEADVEFQFIDTASLRKYANRGNARAQNILGDRYFNGDTVDTDYKEAVKWYKKAAFSGYDVAMYNLGDMYYCGLGVAQDYCKTIEWYKKAASKGIVMHSVI